MADESSSESDDELLSALEASMERRESSSSGGSSSSQDATLGQLMNITGLPHADAVTLLAAANGSVSAAATLYFESRDREATTGPPAPKVAASSPAAAGGGCLFLDLLPDELVRRCLKGVSLANLITAVRVVNKQLSIAAVVERRELLALAEALESALIRFAGETDKAAKTLTSRCRSICFNLSDKKNPDLRGRLWQGGLTPAALVRLAPTEMASSRLRAQRDEWHAKHLWRRPDGSCLIRAERVLGMRCELYRCDECGSKQTRVHRTVRAGQKQVDRARTYATCVDCSARWEV